MNNDDTARPHSLESVVLVHGIWMTGLDLSLLGRRLASCGFAPTRFGYRSVARSVPENAARLARFVAALGRAPVHLVGHSLGGLVILRALADYPDLPPGRVVLLGTPVGGSSVALRVSRWAVGRLLLGKSLRDGLAGGDGFVAPTDRQVGVIAGTASLGVGRLFGGLDRPNDGTVAVGETHLAGASRGTVAASHMGLVWSRQVAQEVCTFLHSGAFATADDGEAAVSGGEG